MCASALRPAAGHEARPAGQVSRLGPPLIECRQIDDELTSLPRACAAGDDRSLVHLDEAADDRKPEPEAACRAIEGLRLLHEDIEDLVEHLGRYTHAFIADAKLDALAPALRLYHDARARL